MAKREKYGKPIIEVKHQRKRFSPYERKYIFKRDNYTCQLCGKDLHNLPRERILDHIVPLAQLGTNKFNNIWLLCIDCDKDKGSSVIPEAINKRLEQLQKKNKTHGRQIRRAV